MKPDLFKVKSPQGMSKQQISEHFKQSILGNEKITVKNISLIRQHKRTFKIANIGTFPAEIKSVTLGNHGASHNGFSIKKVGDSYEIQYEPDFRRSKVTETILVKTKHLITEFKVQAYIPVYLIKFIDTHFRLTEIEDAIGNWYYLIILSFVLLTLLLLGTELVEYIIFLKQKSINYSLITELIATYEKAQAMAKEEEKVEVFNEFLENNRINAVSKTPTKKEAPTQKIEDDPKMRIEEIKRQLAHKIDFSEVTKDSPVVNKKVSKSSGKPPVAQKNEPVPKKETKSIKTQSKPTATPTTPADKHQLEKVVKASKKQKVKDNDNPFEVQKQPETQKETHSERVSDSKSTKTERKSDLKSERSSKASVELKAEKPVSKPKEEEEKGRVSLNESLKSSESNKSKLSKRKLKQEAKKHKAPMVKEVSETPTKEETKQEHEEIKSSGKPEEIVRENSEKVNEYKRGKQSNQPKQNKPKDASVIESPHYRGMAEETKHTQSLAKSQSTSLFEEQKKNKSKILHKDEIEEEKSLKTDKKQTKKKNSPVKGKQAKVSTFLPKEEDATSTNQDAHSVAPKETLSQFIEKEKTVTEPSRSETKPEENKKTKEKINELPQAEESEPIKLFNRQESSKASVASEPNQATRNRLSHAQSRDSWIEQEEAADSLNPKSEYTDEKIDESEDKNPDNISEHKSQASHSATEETPEENQASEKHRRHESYSKQLHSHFSKPHNRTQGARYNAYYKNDYSDLKYYNKQPYYENYNYQRRQRQNRRVQEHPKTSSYQDYKKGLREQKIKQGYAMNRSYYGKQSKYSGQRQDPYADPSDSYEQPQSFYSSLPAKQSQGSHEKEEKPFKSNYDESAQEDYQLQKYEYEAPEESYDEYIQEAQAKIANEDKELDEDTFPQDEELEELEELGGLDELDDQEEEKAAELGDSKPPQGFFEEDEENDYHANSYNMFSAFQYPSKDFSLFAPVQDRMFGDRFPMNFDFLDDQDDPNNQEDNVFFRFDNLDELRQESEHYDYDIANKDISTKLQK